MLKRLCISIALFLTAPAAWADALDGDWCNFDSGKLTINGSTITTPFNIQVQGQYGRHRFEYTAPAGDWNAGKKIILQQFSDDLMELSVDGGQSTQWQPCKVVS